MSVGNTQDGGTQGFRYGQLKRRLKPVTIALLDSSNSGASGSPTQRLLLKNLLGSLFINVSCGPVGLDGLTIRPGDLPTNPGTMQLTPIMNNPEAPKLYLRPVFQDPALPINENHPLPMNIPFGWEGSTEADEVEIEIVHTNNWLGTNLDGKLVVEVTVEYNGSWWDTAAIQLALGQVVLSGVDQPPDFGTGLS